MQYPGLKLALTGLLLLASRAESLDLSNQPLFMAGNLAPNLVLTLDDSGSMRRAFVPEICGNSSQCSELENRWAKSAWGNGLYYDPNETYAPPKNADNSLRSTSFSAAWRNGFYTAGSAGGLNFATTVSLDTTYLPSASLDMQEIPPETYMARDVEIRGNTDGNASFTINDFQNVNGSAANGNPGSNLLSVVVDGIPMTRGGAATSASCTNGRPSADGQFSTFLNGTALTLCFRLASKQVNRTIQVSYLRGDAGPAYYNLFNSSRSGCNDPVAQRRNNACYDTVLVGASSGPGGLDERQNFANWYSFWRTRNLATIAAASLTFSSLSPTTRVAWQALNTCSGSRSSLVTSSCQGWSGSYGSNAIRDFGNGTQRGNFYNWLFKLPSSGGTPLREAMTRTGEYFKTTGENSPYDNDFNTANSGQYSCRRNFHVMMTDGIWNDLDGSYGNDDWTNKTLPDGSSYQYASAHARVYADKTQQTLSDVAFRYWLTDLTNLGNKLVPVIQDEDVDGDGLKDDAATIYWNPRNNPATWQHMVNFTIGLGLTEFLAAAGLDWNGDMYGGSYPRLQSGAMAWPAATSGMGNSGVDYGRSAHDLWHAALNSRGRFFSVDSPKALQESFERILSMVEAATPTAAALAASTNTTGQAGSQTRIFQARFDTRNWDGHLFALEIEPVTASISAPLWDAAAVIPAPNARQLFMRNDSNAATFAWNNLSRSQQAALNQSDDSGSLRLDWLRGDHSKEQRHGGGPFRNRTRFGYRYDGSPQQTRSEWVLGDIISSDPLYVGSDNQHYEQMSSTASGRSSYASYVESKKRRTPVIYVGANDGMLHALRASDGVELFAIIPSAIFPRLHQLTNPSYSHRFYVDGSPGAGDAYLNGTWKTVVASGLRSGGKSVFAVDASTPDQPAASQFMWEFNADEADLDMGYSYSQPQVVRLNNGKWAAVFGNGYGSSHGGVALYVVDLADGSLIRKIEAIKTDADNGLSTPKLIDIDANRSADIAYAGDLKGNVWRFDLSSRSASDWTVGKLFTARDDAGKPQPITVQPTVAAGNGGQWIFLGTGRLLVNGDQDNTDRQSFYGLWDNRSPIENRSSLLQQQVTDTTTRNGMTLRVTTDHALDLASQRGWFLDLPGTSERVLAEATAAIDNAHPDDSRIIFTTALPAADPCNAQGASWLMELSFKGRRPAQPVFDLNQDLRFDAQDSVLNAVVPTGMQSSVGMLESVTWLDKDANIAFKLAPGTSGAIQAIANRGRGQPESRRVSWQQLM